MALVITSVPTGELLSVEETKRHLRVMSGDLDDEVATLIRDARDYCERFTCRTLRTAVTRTLTLADWWPSNYCDTYPRSYRPIADKNDRNSLKLPWPPLIAVSAITYYDTSNVTQTLASSNYSVELSTDGGGRVIWLSTATIPPVYDRPDAITVTFTTGYASADTIPPTALRAMKTKITEMWGSGTDNEVKAAMSATDRLLGMVDWSGYA